MKYVQVQVFHIARGHPYHTGVSCLCVTSSKRAARAIRQHISFHEISVLVSMCAACWFGLWERSSTQMLGGTNCCGQWCYGTKSAICIGYRLTKTKVPFLPTKTKSTFSSVCRLSQFLPSVSSFGFRNHSTVSSNLVCLDWMDRVGSYVALPVITHSASSHSEPTEPKPNSCSLEFAPRKLEPGLRTIFSFRNEGNCSRWGGRKVLFLGN